MTTSHVSSSCAIIIWTSNYEPPTHIIHSTAPYPQFLADPSTTSISLVHSVQKAISISHGSAIHVPDIPNLFSRGQLPSNHGILTTTMYPLQTELDTNEQPQLFESKFTSRSTMGHHVSICQPSLGFTPTIIQRTAQTGV